MRKLLVTGGAGFIGVNFVYYWLQHHSEDRLVVLDALTYAGNRDSLEEAVHHPQFRFVHGNIRDRFLVAELLRTEQIDTIVHFAAESHVDRSIASPGIFLETNVLGTFDLLEVARSVWLDVECPFREHRFHHVSTDEVYGSLAPEDLPFTESSRYDPQSPYAASKAASDHLVRSYGNTYGLQYTISNCSNNYGPYQFPEKLLPLCILNMTQGKPVPIFGDGRNIRDWLYVGDHCRAIDLVLQEGVPGQTYNVGGNSEYTNLDLVEMLSAILDELSTERQHAPYRSLITFVKDRPGHDRRYAINAEKIKKKLGFQPLVVMESGLRATVRWYLERMGHG